MKLFKTNYFLFIVSAIMLLAGVIFVLIFTTQAQKPDHVITLTADGFSPREITIKKGEIVQFRTSRKEFFWPASDFHPTHEMYGEFDPGNPIEPEKSWSFTFTRTGTWGYHDHLSPLYTGVITVK